MSAETAAPTPSNTSSQVTSLSVSLPSHVADDILVIGVTIAMNPTASISGWTKVQDVGNRASAALFWKKATGTDSEGSSVSVTWSGSRQCAALGWKVTGGDTVEDSDGATYSSPTSPYVAPSLTANGANSLLIAHLGLSNTGITVSSAPADMENETTVTSSGAQSIRCIGYSENAVADGATGTRSFTLSTAVRGGIAMLVISEAAGAEIAVTNFEIHTGQLIDGTHSKGADTSADFNSETLAGSTEAKTAQASAAFQSGLKSQSTLQKVIGSNIAIDAGLIANLAILKTALIDLEYAGGLQASIGIPSTSLVPWEPVAGHVGYIWQEGAAWTEVSAASLGITEATADIAVPIEDHIDANREQRSSYTLPAGTFQLTTELRIGRSQKRIIGAGSDDTIIQITGSGKIVFGGSDGSTSDIVGSPSRGDTTVTVLDASICEVGDIIAIKQEGDDTVTGTDDNTPPYSTGTISQETWAEDPWMQMARVTAVDEGTDVITFEPALALDYDTLKNPYVKAFNCDYDLGIEGVTIEFLVDNGNRAVEFDRIERGYAKDVRIYDYAKYGIACRECFEIEVHECRIIGAQDTGTGGNGYSISAELGTTFLHAHDNAMKGPHRHPIIIATGASHCVFAHNYIAEDSAENLTTLSIHGHDCHHNLFEGNIVQGTIEINDFYPATRQNVLYRNKVVYDSDWWDSTSREYAFWIRRNSEAACVANRLSGFANVARVFDGSEGSLIDANGASDPIPSYGGDSRYLNAKPTSAIWSAYSWPVFAGNSDGTIPAEAFNLLVEKNTKIAFSSEAETLAAASKTAQTAVSAFEGLNAAAQQFRSAVTQLAMHLGQETESAFSKAAQTNLESFTGISQEDTASKASSTAIEMQAGGTTENLISLELQAFIAPEFQAGMHAALMSSKAVKTDVEGIIDISQTNTHGKGAETNLTGFAGINYAATVSIQLESSFSAEFQAGLSHQVTTSKTTLTAIEVQTVPSLEFALSKRGFTAIEMMDDGIVRLTHQTGRSVNIEFNAGISNQFLNAEIVVPSVIDVALEHLHQVETGIEGIHAIDMGLQAIHTITISIERTE